MTELPVKIDQKIAVLVDGNNIERSIHNMAGNTHTMVNFDKLIPRILNGRTLARLVYFREGRAISDKLADRLHRNFYGIVKPCHKSADIPLTIEAVQLADKVDTIIIASGDADYIELVRFLKSRGVRVEIAALRISTSRALLGEIDHCHYITSDEFFKFNPTQKQEEI